MYTHRGSWMTQGEGLASCSAMLLLFHKLLLGRLGSVIGKPESCLMVFFSHYYYNSQVICFYQ